MTIRKTSTRLMLGVVGAAASVGVGTLVRHRRNSATFTRAADAIPNALLRTPAFIPRTISVITDDGAALHVRVYGNPEAQSIVFVHGWTCSADYWIPQINAFAENYKVIVYDQRGHGRSDVGTRQLSADVLADDLADVLAATIDEENKAVLVGHSMGGMSIMAWAGRYPDQVHRLVDAVLLASTASDSLVREALVVPLPQRFPRVPLPVGRFVLKSAVPLKPQNFARRLIKYVFMAAGSSAAEIDFCTEIMLGCVPRIRGMWGAALTDLDIREALAHLTVPTSVLVGSADRVTPPVHSRKLANELQAHGHLSRSIDLPVIGHMSSVEAIDAFNAEVARLRHI